jgi:hypothetical protein
MTGNNMDNFTDDASPKAGVPTVEAGVERYSYSTDEEHWFGEFLSREVALAHGRDETGGSVWTGRLSAIPTSHVTPSASCLIETMQERAYDIAGAVSDDWLDDVTPEQEAELDRRLEELIEQWLRAHNNFPRFWEVQDVVNHAPSSARETADQQVGTPAQAESPGDEVQKGKP